MFFYLLAFLVVVTVIVFVHEFGHYFFAKLFGVKVEEFSVGFGREIFGKNDKSGTRWKFCLIPAGGYVKMAGELLSDQKDLNNHSEAQNPDYLSSKPAYQKALVAFGGPLANFIFAFVVLSFLYFFLGKPTIEPIISSLEENSPAQNSGLMVGDKIVKISDQKVYSFADIPRIINSNKDTKTNIVVVRKGQLQSFDLVPKVSQVTDEFGNKILTAKIGASFNQVKSTNLGIMQSLQASLSEIKKVIFDTCKALASVIIGKIDSGIIGGPLRIAKYSGQSLERGFVFFVWFLAMISINLGFINLFPIPMLDGGHLVFYFIEAIRGKAISGRVQDYITRAGMLVLASIFLFATLNDIFFIFK